MGTMDIRRKKTFRHLALCALLAAALQLFPLRPAIAAGDAQKPGAAAEQPGHRQLYAPLDLSQKKYYFCHDASQCAMVQMPCGGAVVINKYAAVDLQGWYDFMKPRYKCAPWLKRMTAKNVTCENYMCRADIVPYVAPVDNSPAGRDPMYCDTPDDCQAIDQNCGIIGTVNKKYGDKLQEQYKKLERSTYCDQRDRRTLKRLTCEKHKCGVELNEAYEAPFRLHPQNPLEVKKFTAPGLKPATPSGLMKSPESRMPDK
ncbi:MAG: hypothetical protein GC185_07000 [Alphaproteobacteria bacterium]|nr:hypothetical protein [Alphaproteobacteria bacterium]